MLSYGTSHRCLEKYIIIHVGNCNILKFSLGRFFLQFKIEFKAVCIYFLINFLYRIVQSSAFTLIEKQMGLLLLFFLPLDFFPIISLPETVLIGGCTIVELHRVLVQDSITTSQTQNPHMMQRAKSKGQWTIRPGFFNLEIFPILFFSF